jgi:hypothetical protein
MKHSRGRPKKIDDVSKSNTVNKKEIVECILCYKTIDLNSRLQEQRIINDTKFCASCFYEILNQEYQQQDDIIYDFWSSNKIRYGHI